MSEGLDSLRYKKVPGDVLIAQFGIMQPIDASNWAQHFLSALGEKREWLAERGYLVDIDSYKHVATFSVIYNVYVNFTPEQLTEYHLRWLT